VKRIIASIPQHELTDPDLILFLAQVFKRASLYDRVIDILTMFLGNINRSWDKENRAAASLAFGEGYTCMSEYEMAASFLHKALAITDDLERKFAVLCQMASMSRFSCNYDDALVTLNEASEILSAESGGGRTSPPRVGLKILQKSTFALGTYFQTGESVISKLWRALNVVWLL
jgi:tetratricopeptide (TPR) repeat protein